MKNRYIPAFIMLAAGLVCCVLCVVQRWPVLNSLITLVISLGRLRRRLLEKCRQSIWL